MDFNADGSCTLRLFGIKNDAQRTGFEIIVRPHTDAKLDPVRTLRDYITATSAVRPENNAVLVTLRSPCRAIDASTVSRILDDSIAAAGLGGKGFSSKSFRPTGATSAVDSNIPAETIMKVGRWKTQTVFMNHYVHSKPPTNMTDSIFEH